MNIYVKIDEHDVSKANKIRERLVCEILWEHDGLYYPSDDWTDFACIILGWWVGTIVNLLRGDDEESFVFMDGPYEIFVKINRETMELELMPKGTNTVWKVQLIQVIKAMIQAINVIYKEFVERQFEEEDILIIKKYSDILTKSLVSIRKDKT